MKTPAEVRAMEVDWEAAAEKWDTAAEFLKTEFTHNKSAIHGHANIRDHLAFAGSLTALWTLEVRAV